MRDPIKDILLVKESRKRWQKKKKAQHPVGYKPEISDYEACTLPLCYNCSPQLKLHIFTQILGFSCQEHKGLVKGRKFLLSMLLGT